MTAPDFGLVARRLESCYGRPEPGKPRPLLDVLVQTILSQNTSDTNSLRAYASLRRAFPSWSEVAGAGPGKVARAIWQGGLANIKARRIVRIVRGLVDSRGRPSLEHLRKLEPEAAYETLMAIVGVGPKTAACTLLFGAGIPVFPVDTHIFRVCSRLGWVSGRETRERFQERMRKMVPARLVYPLHLNLIEHGRRTCRPARPLCGGCCLAEKCLWMERKR